MNQTCLNRSVASAFLLIVIGCFSCSQKRYSDPLSPDEALGSFQLRDGFTIETFAAEPLIADPVDLVFDEQGTAYVVEMGIIQENPNREKAKGKSGCWPTPIRMAGPIVPLFLPIRSRMPPVCCPGKAV